MHVHVVGAGTIGAPLLRLLARRGSSLGVSEVTFHKRSTPPAARPELEALIRAGAELTVLEAHRPAFREAGFGRAPTAEDALARADVILDCTPSARDARQLYADTRARLIVAQGSESGFGVPYVWGVNDAVALTEERFVQVVSCNTHAITTVVQALAGDPRLVEDGQFVLLRRSNDIGQSGGLVGAPTPTPPSDARFGTHHARDAHRVFATLGVDAPLFSAAIKVPTQLMHTTWFSVTLAEPLRRSEAIGRLVEDPRLAVTRKASANAVFSFGRDHGACGRLLNHAVILENSIAVRGQRQVSGYALTPQDGNTLLSNLALVARAADPRGWRARMDGLRDLLFRRV